MFIVFEGIDGAGKTTLSGMVTKKLEQHGVSVHEARPKGELKSRLAQEIRTLARDPRHLAMSADTELFLFIARDTQTIDSVIRPSLDKADVVIADRYLFSARVLCRARGEVEAKDIDQAIDVAARGLWPDLVVYCDVDVETSVLRKDIEKILRPREPEDFGRKGLRGLGLRAAMRREYLALAKEYPERWFVVDNERSSVDENSDLIVERILSLMGKPVRLHDSSKYKPYLRLAPSEKPPATEGEWCDAFYGYLDGLVEEKRAAEAMYHGRSIGSKRAFDLRDRLIDAEPELVAYSLGPLGSKRAIDMRWRLVDKAPVMVALSLSDIWADENDEAWKMREKLAETVPEHVAMTIGGLDTERAWALRERLKGKAPSIVLSSLKGIDTERAWALREELGRKKTAPGLLRGLAHLDTEEAWRLREEHKKNALPWVIMSLLSCESKRAYELRRQYADVATKLVMRSLAGSVSEEAWELRRKSGPWAKESLTTIKNIDSEEAWELRRSLSDTWPGPAAKSVGLTLGRTPSGYEFILDLARRYPHNPNVAHYLVKIIEVRRGDEPWAI